MERLDQLKTKYKAALDMVPELHIKLANVHVENDKLLVKGAAPGQDQVNAFWTKVKEIDPSYSDLSAQISVDSSIPAPAAKQATYTVVAGDSLWKIAEKHLGNGSKFPDIIKANPGKLKDEKSVIHPGDVLNIPAK